MKRKKTIPEKIKDKEFDDEPNDEVLAKKYNISSGAVFVERLNREEKKENDKHSR